MEMAASPIMKLPACAIDEYPSIRLMSRCTIANTFPTVIETAAMTAKIIAQSLLRNSAFSPSKKSRMTTAKAAAFEPTERNAATGVGAPWYTSGTHIWKGTTAILKPKPAISSTEATISSERLSAPVLLTSAAISVSSVDPLKP